MDSPDKQIISILNYLLDQYADSVQDRKYIYFQLSTNGNIQIDAVGSWIKDFCTQSFLFEFENINQTVTIHIGDYGQQIFNMYNIKIDRFFREEPFLNCSDYYVSFVFNIEEKFIKLIFNKLKQFFKVTAPRYPTVKLSITGDAVLFQANDENEKYVEMIQNAISDVIKYDNTVNFHNKVNNYFKTENKHEAIAQIQEKLLYQLAGSK